MLLVSRLEEITKEFIRPFVKTPLGIESQIDHMVIVLRRDNTFDAWINESNMVAEMRAKGDIAAAGQLVSLNDIADISRLMIRGVTIGDDEAYFVVFSSGWRKGFLYDASGLHGEAPPRDVGKDLGAAYAYVLFQERFNVSEEAWGRILAEKWFPFTSLSHDLITKMISHAQAAWPLDELLPEIVKEVRGNLTNLRKYIATTPLLAPHTTVLRQVIDAYEKGQYAIATSAVYPRIEGILRQEIARTGGKPTQQGMAAVPTAASAHRHGRSLLLPARFEAYLRGVVFASEDFSDPTLVQHVTRHSVAHGVAPQEKLDEKAATIGLLIVRHLSLLLSR